MSSELPAAQDKIRQRLVGELIASPSTLQGKVDGCVAVVSAFVDVARMLLGNVGTNAVLRRVSALARRRDPSLASLVVTEFGLDGEHLMAEWGDKEPDQAAAAFTCLIDTVLEVLYSLLGNYSVPAR